MLFNLMAEENREAVLPYPELPLPASRQVVDFFGLHGEPGSEIALW
jgi:hypothetical protein